MIEISINPIMFTIGGLEMGWYGFMIGLGAIALGAWAIYATIKDKPGFTVDNVLVAAIIAIPSALIGARLFHVIDYWDYFMAHPDKIIGFDGLAIWGALIFGVAAVYIYTVFAKINFLKFADTVAPGIFLAQAIGRVGCLFTGCCYGKMTDVAWSIKYTNTDSHGYYDSLTLPEGMGFHPAQVYESIFMLICFVLFAFVLRRFKLPSGVLFLGYVATYSLWRFILGFFRENEIVLMGLSQAQLIGLIGIIISVPIIVYIIIKNKNKDTPVEKSS